MRRPTRAQVGPMIMMGFQGTQPTDLEVTQALDLAREGLIGGIILFGYNIVDLYQVQVLLAPFRETGIFIAVDQEGGRVARLTPAKGFIATPSAYELGQRPVEEAYAAYDQMARQLHKMGFNLNFGPVVDLHSPESAVIGKLGRAYAADPETISALARAFIQAHRAQGILTAIKHFPGHGLARADSHRGLVDITETFQDGELEPFRQLLETASADMVMTAHVIHKDYDADHPATVSDAFIGPILRAEMGYNGVVISDDLQMGAIAQHYSLAERVSRAVKAGVDILLFSNNPAAAGGGPFETVDAEAVMGMIQESADQEAVQAACARIAHLKDKLKEKRV